MEVSHIEAQTERVMTSGELLAKGKSYLFISKMICKISKVNILLKKVSIQSRVKFKKKKYYNGNNNNNKKIDIHYRYTITKKEKKLPPQESFHQ